MFQRRVGGFIDFYRSWVEYQSGFGDVTGEHWLENLYLHAIMIQGHYELRVDRQDWENNARFAKYCVFRIKHGQELHTVTVAGYKGDTVDSMGIHNNTFFSTRDQDNDIKDTNCAETYRGSFWYMGCHTANPNGLYLNGSYTESSMGTDLGTWKEYRF